jgi:glutaredoxin-like protein NrdH
MRDNPKIVLFALSTCNACRKTKDLLNRLGVDYIGADLDTVDIDSRNGLLEKVRRYNPRETFPTLVVDGGEKVVIGYNEEEIKEALNIS